MHTRRIASISVVVAAFVVLASITAHAYQQQVPTKPDQTGPAQTEAGKSEAGKGDSGKPEAPANPAQGTSKWLLLLYIGVIVLLPVVCTIYDMRKSYQERMKVLDSLGPHRTVEETKALLAAMDKGPTGFTGLTRGLVAVTLILVVGIAIFHLVVISPTGKLPDIADKLLMLVAGTLTSIVGFYFGSKAVADATQQPSSDPKTANAAVPAISKVDWDPSTRKLTVTGTGFGDHQGKGTVKTNSQDTVVSNWSDKQIEVTVANGIQGSVNIVVTNDSGKASTPFPKTI